MSLYACLSPTPVCIRVGGRCCWMVRNTVQGFRASPNEPRSSAGRSLRLQRTLRRQRRRSGAKRGGAARFWSATSDIVACDSAGGNQQSGRPRQRRRGRQAALHARPRFRHPPRSMTTSEADGGHTGPPRRDSTSSKNSPESHEPADAAAPTNTRHRCFLCSRTYATRCRPSRNSIWGIAFAVRSTRRADSAFS